MSGKKACPSIFYILLHTNNTILSEYYSYNLYSLSPGLPLWFISVYSCASGLAHDICVRILRFHARSTHQTTTHRHGNMERWVKFTNRVHNWQSLSATTVRPLMGPGDLTEMSNRVKRSENTKNAPQLFHLALPGLGGFLLRMVGLARFLYRFSFCKPE